MKQACSVFGPAAETITVAPEWVESTSWDIQHPIPRSAARGARADDLCVSSPTALPGTRRLYSGKFQQSQ